jgi:hypothetical protein
MASAERPGVTPADEAVRVRSCVGGLVVHVTDRTVAGCAEVRRAEAARAVTYAIEGDPHTCLE